MVAARIEWQIESALIAVLGENADLSGIAINRHHDESVTVEYPCVVVEVGDARDEPWSTRSDYSDCLAAIYCMSYMRDDRTGEAVANLLGAVRDTIYEETFNADMTGAVTGLKVWGSRIENETVVLDDGNIRSRVLYVRIHASSQSIG